MYQFSHCITIQKLGGLKQHLLIISVGGGGPQSWWAPLVVCLESQANVKVSASWAYLKAGKSPSRLAGIVGWILLLAAVGPMSLFPCWLLLASRSSSLEPVQGFSTFKVSEAMLSLPHALDLLDLSLPARGNTWLQRASVIRLGPTESLSFTMPHNILPGVTPGWRCHLWHMKVVPAIQRTSNSYLIITLVIDC